LGQRRGLKNPWARQENVFLVHPQNGLNGLILNWCIGGCCFTPALVESFPKIPRTQSEASQYDGSYNYKTKQTTFLQR